MVGPLSFSVMAGEFISLLGVASSFGLKNPWENPQRDLRSVVRALRPHFPKPARAQPDLQVQVLCSLFFRNKGAYVNGRIINAQSDEIRLMQQWLRDHRQEVPEPSPMGMKMKMGGEEHVMLMPGMLTEEQMKQLDASNGKAFDETFLQLMIKHHQGALVMVKELFGTPGAGQDETTFKLANDISADQETEIARMQKMLVALKLGVNPQTPD